MIKDNRIKETTEALSILALIAFSPDRLADPPPEYHFRPDPENCTKDFVDDLATLLYEMNNIYFIRISN